MSTSTHTETAASRPRSMSPGSLPLVAMRPFLSSSLDGSVVQDTAKSNSQAGPSCTSTISTLRSLYPRAARALIKRDYVLTQSLIESAFDLLPSPSEFRVEKDALDTHRRKWDILRITLEVSAFADPPANGKKGVNASEAIPHALRANFILSAPALITTLHKRSVRLFTPVPVNPKTAFLPAQILISLVYASLKVDCPEVGRGMIEDWLAQRETVETTLADMEGYARVLELFCLNVLPQLHDLDYAKELLMYERELDAERRQRVLSSLDELRKEEIEAARNIPSPPPIETPSASFSRTASPSPSLSSSSSLDSLDTHSTRTVVPTRSTHRLNGFSPLVSSKPDTYISTLSRPASPVSTVMTWSRPSRISESQQSVQPKNTLAVIKTTLLPFIQRFGYSRFLLALLCVVIPVLSFITRSLKGQRSRPEHAARAVLLRQGLGGQHQTGILGVVWREVVRSVGDAIRMAGSGLV